MRDSFIILSAFLLGLCLALFNVIPQDIDLSEASKYILYLLTFSVGLSLGLDRNLLPTIKSQPVRMLLLPFSTMIGTFIGAVAAWLLINAISIYNQVGPDALNACPQGGLGVLDSLCVSAGFGYYSLSSILLNEARGVEIGTMALAANIIRELMTVVFAPLMARFFGPLAPISCGGATSMDSTLPIIQNTLGNQYVPLSIFHGVVMDFSVPLFLAFFISLM